ncbi:MAG: aldose 1-epimerase [Chitinophagaceae bacterium]
MSFAVFTQELNRLEQVILENKNDLTRVIILPRHGAALHAIIIQTPDGDVNLVDQYEDGETLKIESGISFKGSKLSPFPCKTNNGRYTYNLNQYEFEHKQRDGSAIHGLLYNKAFKVVDVFCDDHQAAVRLKYIYNSDDAGYPFTYRCEVYYTLLPENLVSVETTIINLDDITIPLADGWHPYFKLGGRLDDWLMRVKAESVVELDIKGIPTGRVISYTDFMEETSLHGAELNHCFIVKTTDQYAACTLYNPITGLSVSVFPDESYPYLLVFTAPHRESIAVESLSAPPDHLNNYMGTILLAPRHSKTFTVHYKIIKE